MLNQGAKVYKMKYIREGIKGEGQWSVNVVAMSWDDAEAYVKARNSDVHIRIEERGGTWDINAVTPASDYKEIPEVIEKVIVKEKIVNNEEESDGSVTCPWCDKKYKSLKTFETHAKKAHDIAIG